MRIKTKFHFFKGAVFPVVLGGVGFVLFAFPGAPVPAYAALVAAVGLGIVLEWVIPYSRRWQSGDWRSDAGHSLATLLLAPLVNTGAVALVASLGGAGYFAFPGNLPLFAQVGLALVMGGFLPYWLHRVAHESDGFLWRVHAVHHSPERLYWLNAIRLHPVNAVWNVAGGLLPLLFFGFDRQAIFIAGMLNNLVALYNHMNIDVRLGPLNYVFNMNELHRWHHSRVPAEANTNYSGGALAIWDLVFGSRFLPRRRLKSNGLGLFESSRRVFPTRSFPKQVLYPFCRCAQEAAV